MSQEIEYDGDIYYLGNTRAFYEWLETQRQPRDCRAWDLYVTPFKDVNYTLRRGSDKRWLEYHDMCGIVARIPVVDKLYGCAGEPIIYTKKRRNGTRIR